MQWTATTCIVILSSLRKHQVACPTQAYTYELCIIKLEQYYCRELLYVRPFMAKYMVNVPRIFGILCDVRCSWEHGMCNTHTVSTAESSTEYVQHGYHRKHKVSYCNTMRTSNKIHLRFQLLLCSVYPLNTRYGIASMGCAGNDSAVGKSCIPGLLLDVGDGWVECWMFMSTRENNAKVRINVTPGRLHTNIPKTRKNKQETNWTATFPYIDKSKC